jgi:penicillin V acylase-like amidase (Ntn superfamily)
MSRRVVIRRRAITGTIAGSVALFLVVALTGSAQACTRILWNDNRIGVLVSRSMDWVGSSQPKVVALPSGMKRDGGKVGPIQYVTDNPATWTSKYGSVGVTAMGIGTSGGMNEKGLSVNALWLKATDYGPRNAGLPGVQSAMWAQYVLDNAANVEEAIALQSRIQPVEVTTPQTVIPLGLTVEDSTGDSAVIQYIKGELIIHHGRQYTVVSNDPAYDESLALLDEYDFDGATRNMVIPGNTNSEDRFIRASFYRHFLSQTNPRNTRQAVTALLSVARNVSDPVGAPQDEPGSVGETDYRTVADLTNLTYYFESKGSLGAQWVDLADINLKKGAPVLVFDPLRNRNPGSINAKMKPAPGSVFSGWNVGDRN